MNCLLGEIIHQPLNEKAHKCSNGHNHDFRSIDKKMLKISFYITFITMILEVVYGIISSSLALLSDGIHMLTHVFSLAISYLAIIIASKKPDLKKTFGYLRAEVLAAFINALTILSSTIFIVYEAFIRFIHPEKIEISSMLIVAGIGLIVNIITGILLYQGDMQNINIKSSFLHMMSDLLSSVAIVIGGIIVYFTNWYFIDTLLALIISFMIFKWGYNLLKNSTNVLLESSPVCVKEVEEEILKISKVKAIHDTHIVEITHKMYVLTAHIVLDQKDIKDFMKIRNEILSNLKDKFEIAHITIQPEW